MKNKNKNLAAQHSIVVSLKISPKHKKVPVEQQAKYLVEQYQQQEPQLIATCKGTQSERFLAITAHIFASLATAGLYIAARAAHSKITRGTSEFWKSNQEIKTEEMSHQIKSLRKR